MLVWVCLADWFCVGEDNAVLVMPKLSGAQMCRVKQYHSHVIVPTLAVHSVIVKSLESGAKVKSVSLH